METIWILVVMVTVVLVLVSMVFGIVVGRFILRGNHADRRNEESRGQNTQLDRIERSILEGTCVGILAIGIAAIIAGGTIPEIHIGWRITLWALGTLGIIYATVRYYIRRH